MFIPTDSEECEKDEISNTNYSPFSSDRETSNEHEVTTSEGSTPTCQSIQMVEEHYKNSAENFAVETHENSYSSCGSSRNSLVGSTPPPYPTDDFHRSTQSLRFLTPIVYRANAIAPSALDRQHELEDYSNLPYPTTISKDKAVVQNNSNFNTSVEIDNSEVPGQVSCSTPVPTDVTHEKQLHYYSPTPKHATENRYAAIPQGSQTDGPLTLMINENREEPVVNGAIVLRKHRESSCGSHSNQYVGCATPTSCVINQSFHYPTPNLSCITPIIRRENVVFSTKVGRQLASDGNFKLQNSPLSIPINTGSLIVPINQSETTPFRDTSDCRTPIQRDNDNSRNQASGSLLLVDVIPAKRKQVRFASTAPLRKMKILVPYKSTPIVGISQTETATLSQSSAYDDGRLTANSFERHALVSQSRQEEDQDTATTHGHQDETSTAHITKSGPAPEKVLTVSSDSSPKPYVEQEKRPTSATRKRKRPLALPLHTESSRGRKFNSRKSYYGRVHYCHCRTVVRKLKIRDAETQTSP